jgi:endonuclease/exonuclease/phosphatase family metal-dependent hydrolase
VRALTAAILLLAVGCGGDDPRDPLETQLDVMTVNIRHDEDEPERRFELLADEIVRLDPDIIGVQEIEIQIEQTQTLLDLVAEKGGADYVFYEHLKWPPLDVLTGEGIGIYSRFPILESDTADLGEQGRVTVWSRIEVEDGYAVDMYNTHLESGDVPGRTGEEIRLEQAMRTVDFIELTATEPVAFLTGDLNATDDTDAYDALVDGGLVDSYVEVHGAADTAENGNTSPIVLMEGAEQDPTRRIDYVFARTDPDEDDALATPTDSVICFENADEAGFYPTDHLGVMTSFDLVIP